MQIDHAALYVQDLEAARNFFTAFFGATANAKYHNPQTGLQTYFLAFGDGARLEIMTRPDLTPAEITGRQTGYSHLAFRAGNRQTVDALTRRLEQAGYPVVSGPRTTGDGYYESCILGPEGVQIEIVE